MQLKYQQKKYKTDQYCQASILSNRLEIDPCADNLIEGAKSINLSKNSIPDSEPDQNSNRDSSFSMERQNCNQE